jgi:hydroxymethylpyrimidine pyrophosphatase-like HAD family hydrolase
MTRSLPPAGWRPRLVALDIDGTLFTAGHGVAATVVEEAVTPRVQAAIDRVAEAGAHVVLATGRSTSGITGVLELLGLAGPGAGHGDGQGDGHGDGQVYTVASNGSVTFSYPPVRVLSTVTFDASDCVRRLLEEVPHALVAVEEIGVGYRVNRHFPEGEITGEMTLESVDQLVAEPVTRVIIRDPHASEQDFVRLAERAGLHGINYYIGWTAWLDLAPAGVSKASGLASICERLGVDAADVLAVGDGRNDVEMLQWAGRGVAMGQAPPEVQDAADDVTASVQDDGAALELERWFPPPTIPAPAVARGHGR